MTSLRHLKLPLALVAIITLFLSGGASGATLTWDNSAAAGVQDGNGTWNVGSFWTANGGASNVSWNSGTPDSAIIGSGGAAGAITVSGNIEVAGITFNATSSGTYVISAGEIRVQDALTTTFLANQAVTIASTVSTASPDTGHLVLDAAAGVTAILSGSYLTANNGHTDTLSKNGLGTWEMQGTNTIKGDSTTDYAITVNAGTLKLSGAGSFTRPEAIRLNGGTFLLASSAANQISNSANFTFAGGELEMGTSGMDETVGTLTLSGNSLIDFATLASGATIRFANSSSGGTGALWDAFTLNVWNWDGGVNDQLFFGTNATGLAANQLPKIKLYSDSGTTLVGSATINSFGEILVVSTVPEPSTVLVGLGLLSLVGYRERRWILRCREARKKVASF